MSSSISQRFKVYQDRLPFMMQDFESLKNDLDSFDNKINIIEVKFDSYFWSDRYNRLKKQYPDMKHEYFYAPHMVYVHIGGNHIFKVIKYLNLPYDVHISRSINSVFIRAFYSRNVEISGIELDIVNGHDDKVILDYVKKQFEECDVKNKEYTNV